MSNGKIVKATRYILFFLITAVFGIAGLAASFFIPELAADQTSQLIAIVLSVLILVTSILGVIYFYRMVKKLEKAKKAKEKKAKAVANANQILQNQPNPYVAPQMQQQQFAQQPQNFQQQQFAQQPQNVQQSQVDFSATPSDANSMPGFLLAQTQNFPQQQAIPQPEILKAPASKNQTTVVNYIVPSQASYEFVPVGEFQSIEEKFAEIAKMDKTQFVIYMAKLFSRKGYTVKLTPVVDNHGIDMLVEKSGIVIAVSCLKDVKMLSADSLAEVVEGRKYYVCQQAIALTNMFFDKKAFEFAKSNHLSLVDRAILIDEFID